MLNFDEVQFVFPWVTFGVAVLMVVFHKRVFLFLSNGSYWGESYLTL